ncbi:MAG: hypothetical protein AAF664_16835 [Planctomycetota bacterium]
MITAFLAALIGAYDIGYRRGRADTWELVPRHAADREMTTGQIRLLASDTREPVSYCLVDFILIGPDGGNGGYVMSSSGRDGVVKIPRMLSPGRYQIEIDPSRNPTGRFKRTSYHTNDGYLMIRSNRTYTPTEYLVDVRRNVTGSSEAK